MNLIDEFVSRYRREYDFYDQVARLSAQRVEGLIQAAGIRAIVTARAKHPARLEMKVRQRHAKYAYESVEAIYKDIVDLAGVRIALYFPADRAEVDRLIRANFDLVGNAKEFPEASKPTYKKRFSGYWATHYRVHLRETTLTDVQKRYADAQFEVQVASVLMHAWSEVEHDLVYKPLEGTLSDEEYAILDELNGLVIAGEIALERLQKAIEVRVAKRGRKFANHYDLAAYVFDATRQLLRTTPDEADLGRIDLLYALLKKLNLATPEQVAPFLKDLDADTERRPLAEQIIDRVLSADAQRYDTYSELRAAIEYEDGGLGKWKPSATIQHAMGKFLETWINFEKVVRSKVGDRNQPPRSIIHLVKRLPIEDPAISFDLERIRTIRNNLVHGIEVPEAETLESAAARLAQITKQIRRRRKDL